MKKANCIRQIRRWQFVLIAVFGLVIISSAKGWSAGDADQYRHIIVLGGDRSFSDAYRHPLSPVIFYQYNIAAAGEGAYAQFTLLTTSVAAIIGYKTESFLFGIRPILAHSVYGGYTYYDRGVLDEGRIYQGNYTGVEALCTITPAKYCTATASYLPAWYFYRKNTESDNLISENDATTIGLPDNHLEHVGTFLMQLGSVDTSSLGRVKHGAMAKFRYRYSRRVGYGTFEDVNAESSIRSTQKFYGNLGLYLRLPYDFTILLDGAGSYQRHVDRNNAEMVGSNVVEHATMPGYFYGEFLSDRYAIGKAQIGIPLVFWDARVQPGFNLLYMPRENRVVGGIGGDGYPRRIYRSVSVDFSLKLGDVLPFFVSYAYGIDAQRNNAHEGTENKGNHEVLVYILMAF